jgi:hypothetical protein
MQIHLQQYRDEILFFSLLFSSKYYAPSFPSFHLHKYLNSFSPEFYGLETPMVQENSWWQVWENILFAVVVGTDTFALAVHWAFISCWVPLCQSGVSVIVNTSNAAIRILLSLIMSKKKPISIIDKNGEQIMTSCSNLYVALNKIFLFI